VLESVTASGVLAARNTRRICFESHDDELPGSMKMTRESIKPVGYVRWIVVFCTFVIAAVSYFDWNNISIAASALQREFGLTNMQLGTVFSAFIMGYALTQPIAGRIADRFGASHVIAAAILWWSAFTALVASIPAVIPGAMVILLTVRFLLVPDSLLCRGVIL